MRRAGLAGVAAFAAASLPAVAAETTFRAPDWGLSLLHPADLTVGTRFSSNYFDRGAWRVSYAADTGPGTRIVAISLPPLHANDAGGESTATAELRIGASRDPGVIKTCLTYGMNSGNNVEQRTRVIGGVMFTEVPDNGDTEMMKTIQTDDLRAVYDGACWAIDLVTFVGGTSNRRPAYAPEALAKLGGIPATIRFDTSHPRTPDPSARP